MKEMPNVPAAKVETIDPSVLYSSADAISKAFQTLEMGGSVQEMNDEMNEGGGDPKKKQLFSEVGADAKQEALDSLEAAATNVGLRLTSFQFEKEFPVETATRTKDLFLIFDDKAKFFSSVEGLVKEVKEGKQKEKAAEALNTLVEQYARMLSEIRTQRGLIDSKLDELGGVPKVGEMLDGVVHNQSFQEIFEAIKQKDF